MSGPEKPFSCSGCGATFTNEDRLSVHARKHDMVLQLGAKGGSYVTDQTPTPTRFIRNCEEVGLFQDLQNVNPFEETFKRAMEVRTGGSSTLDLESHLTITNPDDTLHTPHIFPHLPDENTSGLFTDSADRSTLTVHRSSSDEGSNQLTVVKCLSTSVEDNLSSVGLHDDKPEKGYRKSTVLVERKIKKRLELSSSKLKLTRQDSIDYPDELNSERIIREYSHGSDLNKTDLKEKTNDSHDGSKESQIGRVTQIPVIAISETSQNNDDIQIMENAIIESSNMRKDKCFETDIPNSQRINVINDVMLSKKDDKHYLDVKTCLKNNFTKLISQRSIDMALVNFTNEAQSKTMDLNNISIEDLPETMTGVKDPNLNECVRLSEGTNVETSDRRKRLLAFKRSSDNISSAEGTEMFKLISSEQSGTQMEDIRTIPVIEAIDGNTLGENSDKGYEIMLKWPDGKKIYLKEVYRDEDQNKKNDSVDTSVSVSNIFNSPNQHVEIIQEPNKVNLKRKLKDMIESNASKVTVSNVKDTNSPIVINTVPVQNVMVPDNYVIVPQIVPDSKIPVLPNVIMPQIVPDSKIPVLSKNIQFVSVVPTPMNNQNYVLPTNLNELQLVQPIDNTIAQPVIRKVLNGKICDGSFISSRSPEGVNKKNMLRNDSSKSIVMMSHKNVASGSKANKTIKKAFDNNSNNEMVLDGEFRMTGTVNEKKLAIQARNRAAVSRYRMKEKMRTKESQERIEALERMNHDLMEKLEQAMREIRNLRQKLTGYTIGAYEQEKPSHHTVIGERVLHNPSTAVEDIQRVTPEQTSVIFINNTSNLNTALIPAANTGAYQTISNVNSTEGSTIIYSTASTSTIVKESGFKNMPVLHLTDMNTTSEESMPRNANSFNRSSNNVILETESNRTIIHNPDPQNIDNSFNNSSILNTTDVYSNATDVSKDGNHSIRDMRGSNVHQSYIKADNHLTMPIDNNNGPIVSVINVRDIDNNFKPSVSLNSNNIIGTSDFDNQRNSETVNNRTNSLIQLNNEAGVCHFQNSPSIIVNNTYSRDNFSSLSDTVTVLNIQKEFTSDNICDNAREILKHTKETKQMVILQDGPLSDKD